MADISAFRSMPIAVAIVATPTTAHACITLAPFQIGDIRLSDTVISGELTGYERVSPQANGGRSDYAILTVQVQSVLKGKAARIARFTWDNSTFNEPPRMGIGTKVIVAASHPDGLRPPLRGPSATILPAPRKDMMQVLQAPCAPAFILPYSKQSEDNLRTLLRGESAPAFNYQSGSEKLFHPEPVRELALKTIIPFVGAAIAVAAALCAVGWSLKRQLSNGRDDT